MFLFQKFGFYFYLFLLGLKLIPFKSFQILKLVFGFTMYRTRINLFYTSLKLTRKLVCMLLDTNKVKLPVQYNILKTKFIFILNILLQINCYVTLTTRFFRIIRALKMQMNQERRQKYQLQYVLFFLNNIIYLSQFFEYFIVYFILIVYGIYFYSSKLIFNFKLLLILFPI